MSFATATCWGFNFILALCWPAQVKAFSSQGAFSWYATWNLFGFLFTWFCLPETKQRQLEELDAVFAIRTRDHTKYYWSQTPGLGSKKLPEELEHVAAVIEDRRHESSV